MENSKWYREGYEAAKCANECPYGYDSAEWIIWWRGYYCVDGAPASA